MRKFGEKSTTAQTVFIVSHINHAEGEDGVLGVYNDMDKAEEFIKYSEKEDKELEWDVDYFLEQRDVE